MCEHLTAQIRSNTVEEVVGRLDVELYVDNRNDLQVVADVDHLLTGDTAFCFHSALFKVSI